MTKITPSLLAIAAFALPLSSAHADDLVTKASEPDTVALDIVRDLTTEIGPRLAASPAEAQARSWGKARLEAMGFANVRVETYQMPYWTRGEEEAEITAPFHQKLVLAALGNSGATPAKGVDAEVVYFPTLEDLQKAPNGSLKGKIAFVSHGMKATQDGSSYGPFGQVRRAGPNIAAQKGAIGIVIRSIGTDTHRIPHTGATNFPAGSTAIPAAALSVPDAENLERIFAYGKPVKMHLLLTPKLNGQQESGNVIAEVPGTDPSLPAIIIGCHLDSWDLGTGAIDNAAGCAIISAAAKKVMAMGPTARTIKILWAGAEEVGGFGGADYAKKHADTPHALAMESDFGADRVWKADFTLPDGAKPLADSITSALARIGVGTGADKAHGGTDVEPIIAAQKLSVIDLAQDGTHYFDLHHTPDDTFDKIDPVQLQQNVTAWTIVLKLAADYTGELAPVTK